MGCVTEFVQVPGFLALKNSELLSAIGCILKISAYKDEFLFEMTLPVYTQ